MGSYAETDGGAGFEFVVDGAGIKRDLSSAEIFHAASVVD
jgi:hypothetical protein